MRREEFTFDLQRFAVINNHVSNTLVSGTKGNDAIGNDGVNVTINAGAGNDTINNWGYGSSITGDEGNDTLENNDAYVSIYGGAGNDSIYNGHTMWGDNVLIDLGAGNNTVINSLSRYATILGGDGDDYIYNSTGSNITINSGKGKDTVYAGGSDILIDAGAGNDYISLNSTNVTVTAGAGNDSIYNYSTNVLFKYKEGDGNDRIEGISATDTLEISGSYSSTTSGEDIIVTVGTGKITLVGAANESIYIEGKKSSSTSNTWKLSGTTATYGTSKKTLVTVKGVKSTDGLSVSGKVVTVAASSLNKTKITVSNGYTLELDDDVSKPSKKKSWSLKNSTATYNQTTSAGYKLAKDAKSISYSKKATKTLATVNGAKSKSGLSISGKTIKLATSALSKKVSVSGDYAFEFASDYKNAKITGSSSADTIKTSGANMTISGGKGNDSLTGSKGADVFVYSNGDGKDIITNYDEADRISIKSGAAKVSTSGDDVIFTVGKGKITLKKAKGKLITYFDASGNENFYPEAPVKYNAKGTGATLESTYSKDSFEPSGSYKDVLVTIDAAAVKNSLQITGNKKANIITGTSEDDSIYGGAGVDTLIGGAGNDELYGEKGNDSLSGGKGEDSLWGGAGSDTLTGGGGKDVFFYDSGNGDDTITDYSPGVDSVIILSTVTIGNPTADSSGDVTFTVDTGQITFQNSANKYIQLVDKVGNVLSKYNPK